MSDPTPTPSPDTIAWAHEALRCFADNNPLGGDAWCARHYVTSGWPCPVALDLAAKIEDRDRQVEADALDREAENFAAGGGLSERQSRGTVAAWLKEARR